jgi:hypothetical protein
VNIAKAAVKALRLTPQGVVAGVIVDKLVEEGIRRCFANQLEWCKEANVEPDAPPNFTWTLGGYTGMTWSSPEAACAYKKTQMTTSPYYSWVWTTVMTSQTTYSCRTTNSTGVVFDVGYGSGVSTCPTGYTLKTLINGDKYCTPTNPTKKEVPASDPDLQTATENQQNKNPGLSPQISEGARKDGQSPDKPEFGPAPTTVTAPPVTTPERESGRSNTVAEDGTSITKVTKEQTVVTPKVEGTNTSDTRITNYTVNTTTTTTIINNVTNQTTTVTETNNSPDSPQDPTANTPPDNGPKECGSPGKPKCQMDESGTPQTVPTTKADEAVQKMQQDNATADQAIASITDEKIAWNWLPQIPTATCQNPQVPNPITASAVEVNICAPFNIFKTFISAVIVFFIAIASVREVQAAIKA